MGVHVNEVHTDIVPAGSKRSGPSESAKKSSTESDWIDNRALAQRCCSRVRAECFSD